MVEIKVETTGRSITVEMGTDVSKLEVGKETFTGPAGVPVGVGGGGVITGVGLGLGVEAGDGVGVGPMPDMVMRPLF